MRTTVERKFVHKLNEENVFVSWIEQASDLENDKSLGGRQRRFIGAFQIRPDHNFFFEHPRNHIPGLYLVEVARQMSIAIAHLFYAVPLGVEFVMKRMSIEFRSFATVFDPLTGECTMSQEVFRKGQLVRVHSQTTIRQNDVPVALAEGPFVLMDRDLLSKIEKRAKNQPSL